MELWIRSQDRLHLKKVNYITINGLDIFCEDFILGTYKTQERALQILDEIDEFIDYMNIDNISTDEYGFRESTIFHMPKE
jgi:hypothetical protein